MTHPIALQELLDTIECGEEHDTAADHLAAIRQAAKAVRATPPLRDWFAGQALIAIAQDPLVAPRKAATWAYKLADAMLVQREVKP